MHTQTKAVAVTFFIGITTAGMVHHRQLPPDTHEHHAFRSAGDQVVIVATASATAALAVWTSA